MISKCSLLLRGSFAEVQVHSGIFVQTRQKSMIEPIGSR